MLKVHEVQKDLAKMDISEVIWHRDALLKRIKELRCFKEEKST